MGQLRQCIALAFAASLLFLAGCCTPPRVTRWEYKVVDRPPISFAERQDRQGYREAVTRLLNDLGKDGWVLVSQTDGQVFYFRRPLKP